MPDRQVKVIPALKGQRRKAVNIPVRISGDGAAGDRGKDLRSEILNGKVRGAATAPEKQLPV